MGVQEKKLGWFSHN